MQEGNIDRDRIVDAHLVVDEYFCPICQCLLWKPRSCAVCQHIFCQKCICTWLESPNSAKRCPFRCEQFEERRCPPYFQSLLARFHIRCRNAEFGCTEVLSYNSLEQHETIECEYLTQRCSECEQLVIVSKLNEHREMPGLCRPRPIKCTICQDYIEKSRFIDHFHRCWENKCEELLEQTFQGRNAQTQLNNQTTLPLTNAQTPAQNWRNWINLLEQQRQTTQVPTNLVGIDAVKQARQRRCGLFYHILMMLTFILANGSNAPFFILFFSLTGFITFILFIFGVYMIFVKRIGIHIYRGCCFLMLFSYIFSYGIPRFFHWASDSSIIYFLGISTFLSGCCIHIPIETLELYSALNMTKINIILYCVGLLIAKISLLLCRFYYWNTPTYLTAAIFAWINFYIAFQSKRSPRNTIQLPPVQTTTIT